jgi:hypothetical protein
MKWLTLVLVFGLWTVTTAQVKVKPEPIPDVRDCPDKAKRRGDIFLDLRCQLDELSKGDDPAHLCFRLDERFRDWFERNIPPDPAVAETYRCVCTTELVSKMQQQRSYLSERYVQELVKHGYRSPLSDRNRSELSEAPPPPPPPPPF